MALFGFGSGLLSFFLVDRQSRVATVVAVLMLVSWLWLILENLLRRQLQQWFGWHLPAGLLRYLTQLIHQESLFFVLPFLLLTTRWDTAQAGFTGLLVLCALVTITDPLYYRQLASRRWLYLLFHSLTLFVLLLTALPIIVHLSTAQSYSLALGSAVLLSLASLLVVLREQDWRQRLGLFGLILALAIGGWYGRALVPPAGLWLTEVAVTSERSGRSPAGSLSRISQARLHQQGLYAFTAIKAPHGLKERIVHVWLHEGREVERIVLPIQGGREAGYRAWTRKLHFPADSRGRWQVRVLSESGQTLGTLRWRVTD